MIGDVGVYKLFCERFLFINICIWIFFGGFLLFVVNICFVVFIFVFLELELEDLRRILAIDCYSCIWGIFDLGLFVLLEDVIFGELEFDDVDFFSFDVLFFEVIFCSCC